MQWHSICSLDAIVKKKQNQLSPFISRKITEERKQNRNEKKPNQTEPNQTKQSKHESFGIVITVWTTYFIMKLNEFPLFVHPLSKFFRRNKNIASTYELQTNLELVGNSYNNLLCVRSYVFLLNSKECLQRKMKHRTKSSNLTLNVKQKNITKQLYSSIYFH